MPNPIGETSKASDFVWKIGITSFIRMTQSKAGSFKKSEKYQKSSKNATLSIGLALDYVIGMERVIPIFHTEFDALQVSSKRLGEIPPFGDFGDFWWLLWLLTG